MRDPDRPSGGCCSHPGTVVAAVATIDVACCAALPCRAPACVVAAALAVVGGSGCGAPPPPSDLLRVAIAAAPDSLDPRHASSAHGSRLAQLMAPALCVVDDALRPRWVLSDPAAVDDGLRYEVRLHDDVPVRDVIDTWREVLDPAFGSHHRGRLGMVERVEAIDDQRVRFTLQRPHAPFVVEGLCGVGIVGAACRQDPARCRAFPVGYGPFIRVDDGAAADRLRLARRVDDGGPGIEVQVVRDGSARLLGLMAGRSDVVIGDVAPWDTTALKQAGLQVARAPGVGFSYLGVSATRAPLADDRVRRALALAVDVPALFSGRLRGQGTLASGLLPDGHPLKDPSLRPPARDVAAARALLDEAGVAPGTRLRLLVSTDRLRRSIALGIASQLQDVGLMVDVEIRDWSVVYEALKAGRFDLVLSRWTPVVEADLLTTVAHSSSIPTKSAPGGNRGGFVDDDVDRWLDEARASTDDGRRALLYGRVERRLLERVPFVPLWHEDEVLVSSPRVVATDGGPLRPWRTGSFLPLLEARLRPTSSVTP